MASTAVQSNAAKQDVSITGKSDSFDGIMRVVSPRITQSCSHKQNVSKKVVKIHSKVGYLKLTEVVEKL